jgi:phospholipid/cholesterol/gamma-HCH transport system substrate-binding protein
MNKAAPSITRVLVMVVFALTCFGLLLFLWLSFGGPVPLKPKGYRITADFPEATTLANEADVRVAGVPIGKVRKVEVGDGTNRTVATLEIERRFAPIRQDAKAVLRQKTLLGETYVEMTPGKSGKMIPEGGKLPDGQIQDTVQLDEIFDSLDPATREAFRTWQQDLGKGIKGRGQDFNDALGTLPGFAHDGADILSVLDSQEGAVTRLVKNTGVVFGALNENEQQLQNLITGSKRTFDATAAKSDALAETIRIFPTFLDESKLTLARVQKFSRDTNPLVTDLRPVARDLQPTLRDVKALAPDLERFFDNLDPVITASKKGLPATREVLEGAEPMLAEVGPFLGQLNPILQYLEANQWQVADFLSYGAAALSAKTVSPGGGVGHYLRQFGPLGAESVGIWNTERTPTNRGNSYFQPLSLASTSPDGGQTYNKYKVTGQFDCANSGVKPAPTDGSPGCWIQGKNPFDDDKFNFQGKVQGAFPHVEADDYSKGGPAGANDDTSAAANSGG